MRRPIKILFTLTGDMLRLQGIPIRGDGCRGYHAGCAGDQHPKSTATRIDRKQIGKNILCV